MNPAPGSPKPGWPPEGAAQHTQWQAWGRMNPAPGSPKPGWPPEGAESHTQWANVGAPN